jgi:pimeloyl-ACP methyl ester carboxylesterase
MITTEKTGYVPVNGLKVYIEIHGSGEPLVLLHGGLGSMAMFNPLLPLLAKSRQVIAVDLQAHGRTADIDRPITCEAMADDIAALLRYLNVDAADIMGYSLGAGVALQTTIRHPAVVKKLVVVSTVFKRDGWYPGILALMDQMGPATAEQMKPSPLYRQYVSVAPRPLDWTTLVTKMSDLLRKDFDWSSQIAAIKSPAMLVFGDADSMPPAHIAEFFGLLGGGQKDGGWDGSGLTNARLAILPGVTHYNIMESPLLAEVVGLFLNIPFLITNVRVEIPSVRTPASQSVTGRIRHGRKQHRVSAGNGAVGG